MGKNQWVSPDDKKWKVQGEGNAKATKIFDNQKDAIDYAKNIAKNQQSELIVQKLNGQIGIKNSYGNDPDPPKDKDD